MQRKKHRYIGVPVEVPNSALNACAAKRGIPPCHLKNRIPYGGYGRTCRERTAPASAAPHERTSSPVKLSCFGVATPLGDSKSVQLFIPSANKIVFPMSCNYTDPLTGRIWLNNVLLTS